MDTPAMYDWLLLSAMCLLGIAILGALLRVVVGPSAPDRVVALDAIGIHLISFTAILSLYLRTSAFLEVVLLIGILAFIGTIAFSKFIERGVVLDRERNR